MSSDKANTNRLYKCAACGTVGFWTEDWETYGSYAIAETCLSLTILVCSDDCRKVCCANIKSGKWRLPQISMRGYLTKLKKQQKGYDPQPSQEELRACVNLSSSL